MPDAKDSFNVPGLIVRLERSALADANVLTVITLELEETFVASTARTR